MRDEHMKETIYLVRKEIVKKSERKRLSFGQFLLTQIRFIGWKIWMTQILTLVFIYLCMTEYFGKYYDEHPEKLPQLLMVLAVVVLMIALPFLYRSIHYRMQEIEAVTYVSSVKLMMARMLIIAIGDGLLLGNIYLMGAVNSVLSQMIIFLCLSIPFLSACNGCLFMATHLKPKYFLQGSIGLCMAMIGLFLHKGLWFENLFQTGIYGLLISGLLIILCIYQVWHMQDSVYEELQIS